MLIKNYSASSVREALAQIKEDMGPGAVILDTRVENGLTRRSSGSGSKVTVTAASEKPPDQPTAKVIKDVSQTEGPRTLRLAGSLAEDSPAAKAVEQATPAAEVDVEGGGGGGGEVLNRLAGLESAINRISQTLEGLSAPSSFGQWFGAGEVQKWLQGQVQLKTQLAEAYASHQMDRIPEPDPFLVHGRLPRAVCFIGPPGAGKSTSLMKTMASWWRREKVSLPIIEIAGEAYPSGGRLAAWAELFNLEWRRFALDDPRKLSRYLSSLKAPAAFFKYDLPVEPDEITLRYAKKMMKIIDPQVTVLVLSATTQRSINLQYLKRYRWQDPTHLSFGHWDLSPAFAEARMLSQQSRLPLAYYALGGAPCGEIEAFTNADLRAGLAAEISPSPQMKAYAKNQQEQETRPPTVLPVTS